MKKVFNKENLNYFILGLVAFTMLLTCSTNRNIKNVKKENLALKENVQLLKDDVNELEKRVVSKDELQTIVEIESYRNSYRNIYDNNSIVRTKVRPDDVMDDYNTKIEQLKTKLD